MKIITIHSQIKFFYCLLQDLTDQAEATSIELLLTNIGEGLFSIEIFELREIELFSNISVMAV